jgi:hypothetical protein
MTNGNETYATPVSLAKAMTAELSVELAEATLYADDGAAEVVKEFQSGTLSLGVDNIGLVVAADLTGAVVDENGVLVSASEDGGDPVAIGFRAKKGERQVPLFLALPRESSAFPPRTLPPREKASSSLRLPLRVRFTAETRWTLSASIRGKRRCPRTIRA